MISALMTLAGTVQGGASDFYTSTQAGAATFFDALASFYGAAKTFVKG